jgi:hypothetical protein
MLMLKFEIKITPFEKLIWLEINHCELRKLFLDKLMEKQSKH